MSSDFTAPVNAEMKVGARTEVVTVVGQGTVVDVQNARQRQVFTGDEVADLPTTRNLADLIQLVPGIAVSSDRLRGTSEPTICSGGQGQGAFSGALSGCSPIFEGFNAHASMNDAASINQGRMQVDGLGFRASAAAAVRPTLRSRQCPGDHFTLSGAWANPKPAARRSTWCRAPAATATPGTISPAYSNERFFDTNDEIASEHLLEPVDLMSTTSTGRMAARSVRDRLWFYSAARRQDRENRLTGNYRNLNEGVFGRQLPGPIPRTSSIRASAIRTSTPG